MRRTIATTSSLAAALLMLLVGFTAVRPAHAQDGDAQEVTVREIYQLRQTALDSLLTLDLTEEEIISAATPAMAGERVKFTGVLLTDVRNSGLASYYEDESPPIGRVHVFVRDTSASSMGNAGMTIQVVDGDFETTGILNTLEGDVVEVDGYVSPYTGSGGVAMQISPISVVVTGESVESLGLNASILEPVSVTTEDINKSVDGGVMINWENYESLNGQFVRIENVEIMRRDLNASDQRPDWSVSSDGGESVVPTYDISILFRNDRPQYYADFNVHEDDFVPPPPGSRVNLQGFLQFQGDDPFLNAATGEAIFSIAPFDADDLEILASPPVLSSPTKPEGVPGAEPAQVTVDIEPYAGRTITEAVLKFWTSASTDTTTLQPTSVEGTTYTYEIPAQEDGAFVSYYVTATDDNGATADTQNDAVTYRVLTDGIRDVEHIQRTASDAVEASPFVGVTADMDLEVVVTSQPAVSGMIAVQDGDAAWSGVLLRATSALEADLAAGDSIRITQATVEERYGVTQLRDVTYEVLSTGNAVPAPTVLTTDALQDDGIAEQYEGMRVRFENATIVDATLRYGEWLFSTDGTRDNAVTGDDASDALDEDFASSTFSGWEQLDYLDGIWWFSFGAYKLVPETSADFGTVTNVATEDGAVPGTFALEQNYPNPFNPVTTLTYTVGQTGPVHLRVFDVLGREVATLVDEAQPAGTYRVRFDGAGLASGLYLYRLSAEGKTLVRTMMLLK